MRGLASILAVVLGGGCYYHFGADDDPNAPDADRPGGDGGDVDASWIDAAIPIDAEPTDVCGPNQTDCGGCVETSSDPDHCGDCTTSCGDVCFASDCMAGELFSFTGAPQTFAVPAGVTSLTIDAIGATGAHAARWDSGVYLGGAGARVTATIEVTPDESLTILVGEHPGVAVAGADGCGAGGGGGTYVLRGDEPLVVAGGGGGAAAYSGYASDGGAASVIADGASSGGIPGGTGGLGGSANAGEGGGGAGYLGGGFDGSGFGGSAALDGGAGGTGDSSESCGGFANRGGFGGGGGGGNDGAGGGGGYSGGAAQLASSAPAGGGGSYAITGGSISLRNDRGHGAVLITY